MKALLLSIVMSTVALAWILNNNEKKAILLVLFTIPFFYSPLENTRIHLGLTVGMSGVILFMVWLLLTVQKKIKTRFNIGLKSFSPNIYSLYYFLVIGIVLGLIYYSDGILSPGLRSSFIYTPVGQLVNNSIYVILVLILLRLLVKYQYNDSFRMIIAQTFSFTIVIQVISQILNIYGWNNFLWGILTPEVAVGGNYARNYGLFLGFGMGVYVVLLVALSSIYYNKNKNYSRAIISLTIVFSFLTGARQTIAFILLYLIIVLIFYMLKRKLTLFNLLVVISIFISTLFLWEKVLSNTVIVHRFVDAIESYNPNENETLELSGRDAKGLPFIMSELRDYPWWGKGLLNLYDTKNSGTNIAGHIIWFNIYKKFGVVGVIYLILIIVIPIIKMSAIVLKTKDKYVFKEGAILSSLMVIVFAQQFWDNFLKNSNSMLLYAFVYFWVFSFLNRQNRTKNLVTAA